MNEEYYQVKKKIIYLLTIIMLIGSIFFILPNLSTNLSNYKKIEKTLAETHIEEFATSKQTYRTFTMKMTDSSEYVVSNDYDEYWAKIQNKNNLNKKVTMYISNYSLNESPIQLTINKVLIYNVKDDLGIKYLFLILTLGMCIYIAFDLKKGKER